MNPLPEPTYEEAHNARPPVADDDHPPLDEQIRSWLRKDGKTPGYYGADSLQQRTAVAEHALGALMRLEFMRVPNPNAKHKRFVSGIKRMESWPTQV
jgi:hypothetical protein